MAGLGASARIGELPLELGGLVAGLLGLSLGARRALLHAGEPALELLQLRGGLDLGSLEVLLQRQDLLDERCSAASAASAAATRIRSSVSPRRAGGSPVLAASSGGLGASGIGHPRSPAPTAHSSGSGLCHRQPAHLLGRRLRSPYRQA